MVTNTLTGFGTLDIPVPALLAYRKARAAALAHRYHEALEHFDEALAQPDLPGAFRARTLEQRGDCHGCLGNYDAARRSGEEALSLYEDPVGRARAYVLLGEVAEANGRLDEATTQFDRALGEATGSGDLLSLGRAQHGLGVVQRRRGYADRSTNHLTQALAIFRQLGNAREQGRALTSLALTHLDRGEFQQSITAYQEALRIFDTLDEKWAAIPALNGLGACYQSLFDVTAAYRTHQQAYRLAQGLEAAGMMPAICRNLGVDLMELDRAVDARAYLEQSLEDARRLGRLDLVALALYELTRLGLREGDLPAAERSLDDLTGAADALAADRFGALVAFARGELRYAQGRPAEAAIALQEAALSAQTALDRGTLWKLHAALSHMAADPQIARVHLHIATDFIRQTIEPLQDPNLKHGFLQAAPVAAVLARAGIDPAGL